MDRFLDATSMLRPSLLLALALATTPALAADLTATERQWLSAGWDVVAYAQHERMPLDIVVQPDSRPGDAPLAMGFEGGGSDSSSNLFISSMR